MLIYQNWFWLLSLPASSSHFPGFSVAFSDFQRSVWRAKGQLQYHPGTMWTRRPWNICKSAFAAASTKKLQLQLSSNGFRVPMCLKEFGCHIISPCLAYGARTTFLACLASSHGSSFLFADDCCLLVSHIFLRIGNRCSLCPKKFFKFCSLNAGYAGVVVFFTCICIYIYTHSYNRLYYWSLFIAAVWDFQVTETCCFGCALLFSPRCVARSFCLPRRVPTIVMPRRVIC